MYVVKQCTKCKEYRLLEEFRKANDRIFGTRNHCKSCEKKYMDKYHKNYYLINKSNILYKKKIYDKENRINRNKYTKQRRQTDSLFKMRGDIRNLIYCSMKRQGYTKSSKTYKILGCDFNTFKKTH